jgi:hypothetical protein
MTKPEDIPQSVWDVAKVLVFGEYFTESAGIAEVARAILAAKAEEREACELIAETEAVRVRRRQAETTDSHKMLVNQAWGMCADTAGIIRDAIRNRTPSPFMAERSKGNEE